jgi:ferric enterobactin receptor
MGLRYLLLVVFVITSSLEVCAQWKQTLYSISFEEEPMDNALRRLGDMMGVRFAYDAVEMRIRSTALRFENTTGEQLTTELLSSHGFTWREVGNVIAVIPLPKVPVPLLPSERGLEVSGLVKDKWTGETLPYARVEIAYTTRSAQTDEYGKFLLENIPADTCELVVAYVGYSTYRTRLAKGKVQRIEIELEPGRLFLPSAVIEDLIAPQIEITDDPGTIILNPVEIAASATGGEQDVMRAPQLLPGINGTRENNGGLIIRGSDPDQSLVNFDGYTLYHLDHFFGLFSSLNANAVKAIRVHKGPFPASLGGRVGGVVEVLGKDGNNLRPNVKIDAGPLAVGIASDGPLDRYGKARYLVAYRRALTDVVKGSVFQDLFNTVYNAGRRSSGGDSESTNTALKADYGFQDLTARLSIRPNDSHLFQWSGFLSGDRLALQYRDSSANRRFAVFSDNNSRWGNTGTGLRHMWSPKGNGSMRVQSSVGFSRYTSSFLNTDSIEDIFFTENTRRFRSNSVDLRDAMLQSMFTRVYDSLEVNAGIVYNRIDIRYDEIGATTGSIIGSDVGDIVCLFGGAEGSTKYGQWYMGSRVTYYNVQRGVFPEWRFGWKKRWNDRWSASLGVDRIYQFVHRIHSQSIFNSTADAWRLSGTQNVPVLRSDQLTASLGWHKGKWRITISPFTKWNAGTFEYLGPYRGLINGLENAAVATGKGRVIGVDGLAQYHYGRWNAWLSVTWMKAYSVLDAFGDQEIPELFDQRLECKAYAEYAIGWWKLSAAFLYGSGTPFTAYSGSVLVDSGAGQSVRFPVYGALNGARLPSYVRSDISVSRKWMWNTSHLSVVAAVQNISNAMNVNEVRYFPASDFSTTGDFLTREVRMLPRLFTLQIHYAFL